MEFKTFFILTITAVAFVTLRHFEGKFRSKKYTVKDYNKSDLKGYSLQKSILTRPELILYRVLRKHLNTQYIVGTKIRLADFIKLNVSRSTKGPTSTHAAFNRISGKHADFMICALDGRPLAWIELDDKSHGTRSAKKADAFKNDVARIVGLPIYRIKTGTDYNQQVLAIMGELR